MGEEIKPGLITRAKEQELRAFRINEAMLSDMSSLSNLLEDLCGLRWPKSHDYANREDLIRIMNVIAIEIFGKNKGPVVEGFGSFLINIFSKESDLDLSLNFKAGVFRGKKEQQNALRRLLRRFDGLQRGRHVRNVQLILSARVPVLKVTDCGTGIECDISVENRDGITKSQILRMIAGIDERFQKLSFLVKAWAKEHGINSARDGSLNSISLILLSAFHLQNRDPPILPPFSEVWRDGWDLTEVENAVSKFSNYGLENKESLAQLFTTFLRRLEAVKTLWTEGLCASVYEGSWIYKKWKNRICAISVEDFSIREDNVARSVKSKVRARIYWLINDSLNRIQAFTDGQIDGLQLRDFLFGSDEDIEVTDNPNNDHIVTQKQPVDHVPAAKRIRLMEEGEGRKQFTRPSGPSSEVQIEEYNGDTSGQGGGRYLRPVADTRTRELAPMAPHHPSYVPPNPYMVPLLPPVPPPFPVGFDLGGNQIPRAPVRYSLYSNTPLFRPHPNQ